MLRPGFRKIDADDQKRIHNFSKTCTRKRFRTEVREQCDGKDFETLGLFAIPLGQETVADGWSFVKDVTIPKAVDFWLDVQVSEWDDGECEPMEWFRATFSAGRLVSLAR